MPKKLRTCRAVLAGLAAAGLSGALVIGHATNTTAMVQLTNTVIGIGGRGDPLSARVPAKLSSTVVPTDYDYFPVLYPASVALDNSRDIAVPLVHKYVTDTGRNEAHLIVAGYSLGTLAAEQEKRNLQKLPAASAPAVGQLTFVMIASPFAANGGIFNRFPGWGIPFVTAGMGATEPSRYDTTFSALMYDTYADFPAYFNPLSLLNAALSIRYGHPDEYYDQIEPATSYAYVTNVEDNGAGGDDRYLLYYNPHLPLLGPLRELASLTGTSGLVEPLLGAVEPLLRVLVDMGYTDRVNANPTASVPFSLITPPQKIIEALAAVPGALAQGAANLMSGGHAASTPPNPIGNLQPKPTMPPVAAQVQSARARVALAPPEADAPSADPTPSASPSPPPTVSPNSAEDGLHPTVTNHGNKFAPGSDGTAAEASASDGGTPASPPKTTPPKTTTAATTTTTAEDPADTDEDTGEAGAAAAA